MAEEKRRPKNSEPDLLDKLFGDPAELSSEELDLLYGVIAPGESPNQAIYQAAERAAVKYRRLGKLPPEHVRAALDATRSQVHLAETSEPVLRKIIDKLTGPVLGPVADPAFAYLQEKELSANDQKILDALADELSKDWEKDKQ